MTSFINPLEDLGDLLEEIFGRDMRAAADAGRAEGDVLALRRFHEIREIGGRIVRAGDQRFRRRRHDRDRLQVAGRKSLVRAQGLVDRHRRGGDQQRVAVGRPPRGGALPPPPPPLFTPPPPPPSRSPRPLPTKRASVSATPPGAKATMKVMSRAGYGWALAACTPSPPPSAAKAMTSCLKTRQFGIAIPPSRPIVLIAGGGADGRIVPPNPRLDKVAMSQQRPRRRVRSFRRLLQFSLSLRTRPRIHKTRCRAPRIMTILSLARLPLRRDGHFRC